MSSFADSVPGWGTETQLAPHHGARTPSRISGGRFIASNGTDRVLVVGFVVSNALTPSLAQPAATMLDGGGNRVRESILADMPVAVLWSGDSFVLIGARIVRMSRDGVLVDERPYPSELRTSLQTSYASSGQRVLVVTQKSSGAWAGYFLEPQETYGATWRLTGAEVRRDERSVSAVTTTTLAAPINAAVRPVFLAGTPSEPRFLIYQRYDFTSGEAVRLFIRRTIGRERAVRK